MKISTSLDKSVLFMLVGCFLWSGLGNQATAGNKEMVDENVQELDKLNKQAVKQIPNLPRTGTIDLKAKVFYKDGSPLVDVYEKTVTTEEESTINLNKGYSINSEKESEKLP